MTKYLKDLILNHTTYDLSDVPDDAVLLTLDFGPKTKALKKAFRTMIREDFIDPTTWYEETFLNRWDEDWTLHGKENGISDLVEDGTIKCSTEKLVDTVFGKPMILTMGTFRQYSCPDKKITPDKVPLLKLMEIVWDMVDRVAGAPLDFYLPSTEPRKTWLVQSDYIKDLKDPTPFPMTDDQVGAYHQLIPADNTF